jgi:hypothetical protein
MSRTRKQSLSLAAVVLALSCRWPFQALADGGYFSRTVALTSDQRAIVISNGQEISLTLSTAYTGEGEDFGWIIPTPVPVAAGDVTETGRNREAAFGLLDGYTAPQIVSGGCFPAETEVLTSAGPREISSVEPGTHALSYDFSERRGVLRKVLRLVSQQYAGDMNTIELAEATIRATGNHPFFVTQGDQLADRPAPIDVPNEEPGLTIRGRWVEARDLAEGDVLAGRSGQGLPVTRVSRRHEETIVYNLMIEGSRTYAVHRKGVLVHNKGGKETTQRAGVSVYATVSMAHYEASLIGATTGSALLDWLEANGYQAGQAARQVLDAYIDRGWSFVALKLTPGKKRHYEKEFLPAVTIMYRSDQIVFPLLISSVSTIQAARITLYVIAESTAWSDNYPTKALLYDRRILKRSRHPAAYILDRIRETLGSEGRGLVVLWRGRFTEASDPRTPYDPQPIRELMRVPFPAARGRYLTRLEAVMTPSAMTEDIRLLLDKKSKEFHVDNVEEHLAATVLAFFIVFTLVCITLLIGLLLACEAIAVAGVAIAGLFLLARLLIRRLGGR